MLRESGEECVSREKRSVPSASGDVIHHAGPGLNCGFGHLGAESVDRNRDFPGSSFLELLDHRNDPVWFGVFGFGVSCCFLIVELVKNKPLKLLLNGNQLRSGASRHASDVDDRSSFILDLKGPGHGSLEGDIFPAITEAVWGGIQDSHHQGLLSEMPEFVANGEHLGHRRPTNCEDTEFNSLFLFQSSGKGFKLGLEVIQKLQRGFHQAGVLQILRDAISQEFEGAGGKRKKKSSRFLKFKPRTRKEAGGQTPSLGSGGGEPRGPPFSSPRHQKTGYPDRQSGVRF